MKGINYKLNTYEQFKMVWVLLKQVIEELEDIVQESKMLQADLLVSIAQKTYIKKGVPKLASEPEKYHIKLNHIECLAFLLILKNYDFLESESPLLMSLMTDLVHQLDQYIISSKKTKISQCDYLLESNTNESRTAISNSERQD